MKELMKTQLTDGLVVIYQGIIFFFFGLINILVWFILIWTDITLVKIYFATVVTFSTFSVFLLIYKSGEVYIENGFFQIKKLFGSSIKPFHEFTKVTPIGPVGYSIVFKDRDKVLVFYSPEKLISELGKRISDGEVNRIRMLITDQLSKNNNK